MFSYFFRIIKFSFQDIFRNIWLSLVTLIILVLALFTINMLIAVQVVGHTAVEAIKDKIDINLFIKSDAPEDQISALKARIEDLDEVKEVSYISKTEALATFREKHHDDPEILESLRELGKNPLSPSFIIKPTNLDVFDNLLNQLNGFNDDIIESRNFADYKLMLTKIDFITEKVKNAGLVLSGIFILITILVIYNSVRIAIFTHKREIAIMRLVGASNWFIQMPYLISSFVYTFAGVVFIMAVFYPFLTLLQPYLETFFVGYNVNLVNFFYGNFLYIFGTQFLIASFINGLASLIAVKKYSNV